MDKRENVSPSIMDEEYGIMNAVYTGLESEIKDAEASVKKAQEYVDSGAYEDQDAFLPYSALGDAQKKEKEVKHLNLSLHEKPYFAHMRVVLDGQKTIEMLLSDNENLHHCPNNTRG